MRTRVQALLGCLLLAAVPVGVAHAQTAATAGADPQKTAQLAGRIEAISSALQATQRQIEQSQRQMQDLQQQLVELRQELAGPDTAAAAPSTEAAANPDARITAIEERQQTLEAAVKLHDQTKVESGSKYPVRLTGL